MLIPARPSPSILARGLAAARRGFTLIELMAVILIISILMIFLVPKIVEAVDQTKVLGCKKNLQEIYSGFKLYEMTFQRLPNESGARFFAVLISRKVWENTEASAKKLTCPGVDLGALAGIQDREPTEWYSDLELVMGDCSAYAGRDCKQYPLRKLSGLEALVADDNDPEMNHSHTTNVLFGDGAVQTFELVIEQEKGNLLEGEEILVVGPDSKIEPLRKLSLN